MIVALALTLTLFVAPDPVPEDAVFAPAEPCDHTKLGVPMPIENPPGEEALAAFYQVLRRVARRDDDPATPRREDQARVVVWGASHVAGDMFTGWFRNELKSRYGDAGIGLIVPSKPWRDYYNRDANIAYSETGWDAYWVSKRQRRDDGRYGLGGISFTSDRPSAWAKVSTSKENPFGRDISHVEVWYWRDARGGDFTVDIDHKKKIRVRTKTNPKKRELDGLGYWSIDLPLARHEVEIRPAGNGAVTLFAVALDSSAAGIRMDTLGINGARATDQLDWDPGIFNEQLIRRDPDLVVLAYGTNDVGDDEPLAEYERKLDLVVNRVHSAVPRASCLLIGPSDRPVKIDAVDEEGDEVEVFQHRPRQAPFIDVQRKVAHRYGCGYWNWAGAMGGDLSMLRWVHADIPYAAPDYVHLTKLGYERMAQLFLDALIGPFEGSLPGSMLNPGGPTIGPAPLPLPRPRR